MDTDKAAHTAGPWKTVRDNKYVYAVDGPPVCELVHNKDANARMIMAEPGLEEMFETRELKA